MESTFPLKAPIRPASTARCRSGAHLESERPAPGDPDAHLAAGLLLATWSVAFIQAHRTFRQSRDAEKAKAVFLALVDQGTIGLKTAMAGTPYA